MEKEIKKESLVPDADRSDAPLIPQVEEDIQEAVVDGYRNSIWQKVAAKYIRIRSRPVK